MGKPKLAIARTNERGLMASEAELAKFQPDYDDRLLLEALLQRAVTYEEIAKLTDIPLATVKDRLLDPVRCAYLAEQAALVVQQRRGMVMAALYARAVRTGDVNAARLYLQQIGELMPEHATVDHRHAHVVADISQFSDEQLTSYIREKERELGTAVRTVPVSGVRRDGDPAEGAAEEAGGDEEVDVGVSGVRGADRDDSDSTGGDE